MSFVISHALALAFIAVAAQHTGGALAPTHAHPVLAATQEEALRAQVTTWWSARERRDHQAMYALMEPAYREKVSFADFLKESAIRARYDLSGNRIEEILPETAARVRVKVSIETHLPRFPAARVTAEDVWVLVANAWYKVYQAPALPFPASARGTAPS
jgi:hypothetical protein